MRWVCPVIRPVIRPVTRPVNLSKKMILNNLPGTFAFCHKNRSQGPRDPITGHHACHALAPSPIPPETYVFVLATHSTVCMVSWGLCVLARTFMARVWMYDWHHELDMASPTSSTLQCCRIVTRATDRQRKPEQRDQQISKHMHGGQ